MNLALIQQSRAGWDLLGAEVWALRAGAPCKPPPRSADGWRVLQAALVPQLIEPAGQTQRSLQPDIALEAFAVIAHVLDDIVAPILRQTHHLAHVVADAEHALQLLILRRRLHLVDVGLGDALLFGDQHGKEGPPHDPRPSVIPMSNRRRERLL